MSSVLWNSDNRLALNKMKKFKVNNGREFSIRVLDNSTGETLQNVAFPGDIILLTDSNAVDVVITDGKRQQRIPTFNYPNTISHAVKQGVLTEIE